MGLFSGIFNKAETAKTVSDTVIGLGKGVADIIDQFVETAEDKENAKAALRDYILKEREQAMEKDQQILNDRASARQMAGIHGKLQFVFAVTFLIGFLVMLVGFFVFIGMVIRWEVTGGNPLSDFAQTLVTSTLAGSLGYMVSMLKEVVGFLFGGSAGGDETGAAMVEMFRQNGEGRKDGSAGTSDN